MQLPIYQIDAFAERPFTGNPAAVVPLDHWPDDALLQAIALENNLSETAYIVPDGDGWQLRWFTPAFEVALCGHATLATAHALCHAIGIDRPDYIFHTRKSGTLIVRRDGDLFELDFPAVPTAPAADAPDMSQMLDAPPDQILYGAYSAAEGDYMAVYGASDTVAGLRPDFAAVAKLGVRGVIATAPGDDVDFVSRYFAPGAGIDEDPVTGSAHCLLTPYWAQRLGKTELTARQISARGGWLRCRLAGDRVRIAGRAVAYMSGTIEVPDREA